MERISFPLTENMALKNTFPASDPRFMQACILLTEPLSCVDPCHQCSRCSQAAVLEMQSSWVLRRKGYAIQLAVGVLTSASLCMSIICEAESSWSTYSWHFVFFLSPVNSVILPCMVHHYHAGQCTWFSLNWLSSRLLLKPSWLKKETDFRLCWCANCFNLWLEVTALWQAAEALNQLRFLERMSGFC